MIGKNRTRGGGGAHGLRVLGRRGVSGVSLALLAAVALGIAAGTDGHAFRGAGPARTAASACASVQGQVARPAAVPAAVLPPETVLGSVERMDPGITIVRGVVGQSFQDAVDFFVRLPAAGYRLSDGDAEATEAESRFAGRGLSGKWKVNGIVGCPGAVRLALYVKPD